VGARFSAAADDPAAELCIRSSIRRERLSIPQDFITISEFPMRHLCLIACAGLAAAVPALAQTQHYIMVPHTVNGVMLFDPANGATAVTSFIPKTGPAWSTGSSVLKAAVQVENEIWITIQANDTILRFDLNGRYYGKITENLNNCRGMWYHNGVVYVVNSSATGGLAGPGVHRFDTSGNYLGGFDVGTSPWDVAVVGENAYVSSQTNVLRYHIDGTPLGIFFTTRVTPWQIAPKPAGGFYIAGQTGSGLRGIYELDSAGNQVRYLSTESGTIGVRGMAELGNGNFIWTSGSNIHMYDILTNSLSVLVSGNGQHVTRLAVNTAAVGACCFLDGTCGIRSIADCGTEGGVFRGDATTCATAACPPSGACCMPDGTCVLLPADHCTMQSGLWSGAGTSCGTANCPFRLITLNASGLTSSANGSGIYFDLISNVEGYITQIDYVPGVSAGNAVTVDIYTREGSYVGFDADPSAWTHLGTVNTTSLGTTTSSPYTPLELPAPVSLVQNGTTAFYIVGTIGGYRYRGSATVNPVVDQRLSLYSDLARSEPFAGTANTGRRFMGAVHYFEGQPTPPCYANCDGSTTAPVLNVDDFTCFINEYASAQGLPHEQQVSAYANCDGSTIAPALNVDDFTCFINAFAQGCP
jgi:hypothetical protein